MSVRFFPSRASAAVMSSVLTVVFGIGVGACASSEEETPESAAHAQSSPIAPPVDRPDPPFPCGLFTPAAQLPRTPIIIPDGPVQRFQLGSTTVEITRVNAGADRKVSQPEAGVM